MQAGKHVLTEKLMGHSVHECKEMARVAQQLNKILATGHQRHYSILYDNAVDTIRRGLIGDIHSIRAQWHRDNLPGHDSWSLPLPDDKMGKRLERLQRDLEAAKGLVDRQATRTTGRGAEARRRGCAGQPGRAAGARRRPAGAAVPRSRREGRELRLPGDHAGRRPPPQRAGRADSLAAVEPHRRRADGRAGQPPARRGGHLHQRPARRRPEGAAADRLGRRRPARCSRSIATARTTSIASTSSRAPTTTRIRTRRSASPTRRSTATASAATAKPCLAPRAR